MDSLPNIPISYGTAGKTECRILENDYGDGYNQRAADGLNSVVATWDVVWEDVSVNDIDTLEAFFEAKKGYIAFLWTPPRRSVAKKWICKEWSRDIQGLKTDRLRATFIQEFNL